VKASRRPSDRSNRWQSFKKRLLQIVGIGFLALNLVAFAGAYGMTHYSTPEQWALGLPKPASPNLPSDVGLDYVTHRLSMSDAEWLEAWFVPAQQAQSNGTVLLFPGNGGSKAKQLLASTQSFHQLGYDAFLVDFRGVGGSSGNTGTIGMREAKDVAFALNAAPNLQLKPPYILYGISMGTSAILKAVAQEGIEPNAIILELPFARLIDAVRSRLRDVRFPTFPMAELIVFWGSVQHGSNGFAHNPVNYARQVERPTLLLHSEFDKWTTTEEINQIFENLSGEKQLVIFPDVGHNLLVTVNQSLWEQSINQFLNSI